MIVEKDAFKNSIENIFSSKKLEEAANIVFVFSSTAVGHGEKSLGELLMESYIYALSEIDIIPKTIILYNEAALLATASSECNLYLKKLHNKGSEILICATCAKYFEIVDKITVGKITNMTTIIERKLSATKLINV